MVSMLLGWCRGTGSPEMAVRARSWLNQSYLGWLTEARVQTDSVTYQVALTASMTELTDVPIDLLTMVSFKLISRLGDTKVAGRVIQELTPVEMDTRYPNRLNTPNTGMPGWFTYKRVGHPVDTGAAGLWVCSTATAVQGDSGQLVGVVGYPSTGATARGRLQHQQVVLNGTTRVAVPVALPTLIQFSKSADTVGYVQLWDAATNGNLLMELMPWERASHRPVIEIFPYPDVAMVAEMRYNRKPPVMMNDADVPFYLPAEFHMGLVYYSAAEFGASFIDDDRIGPINAQAKEWRERFLLQRRLQDRSTAGIRWSQREGRSNRNLPGVM